MESIAGIFHSRAKRIAAFRKRLRKKERKKERKKGRKKERKNERKTEAPISNCINVLPTAQINTFLKT